MALRLNEGKAWRHPLESGYARARRRLIANPALSRAHFNAAFAPPGDLEGLDRLSPYVRQVPAIRQCPDCARHLFHPTVYQVESLPLCPIHHRPFTLSCPDCHQRWDRVFTAKAPACATCGRPDRPALARTQLPARVYRELGWLDGWLARCQRQRHAGHHPTLYDVRALIARVGDIESPPFRTPTLSHPFYAAFEAQKRHGRDTARLRRLGVQTLAASLRMRQTTLTPWLPQVDLPRPLETWDGPLGQAPDPSPRQLAGLALALRRLLRWQGRLTGRPHRWIWWDLRALRPEQVRAPGLPCVLCLAFSYWCHAVTWKYSQPSDAGTPGEHELCRFTAHTRFPLTPEGVYRVTPDQQRWRPSPDFERWLYLRATDYLFLECVQFALWVQHCAAASEVHFQQTAYRQRYRFQPPPAATQLLDLELQGGTLKATYWYTSPLQELVLPAPARRGIDRCAAVLRYPCRALWSVGAAPRQVDRSKLQELFREVLPRLQGSAYQYPHSTHFYSSPPTPTSAWHDLRAVIGDDAPGSGP